MRELLDNAQGQPMDLSSYLEDFEKRFWKIGSEGFWKLERRQSFQEPGVESWEAFVRGDWEGSLRLIESRRSYYEGYLRRISETGFSLHRVRVVEEPVTPYLQWELHLLWLKAQCGEDTRVLTGDEVSQFEAHTPLPELIVLGLDTMYEIIYTQDGVLDGAIRFMDRPLIQECRSFIQSRHSSGVKLGAFFEKKIAGLGAPTL